MYSNNLLTSSKTHYDPFGMLLEGRSWEGGSEYRFGFNGKEGVDEIVVSNNALDYGARIYDGRIGKWFSVDPKFNLYPSLTPYCFAGNNPILFLDAKGEDIIIYYENAKGQKKPVFEIVTDYDEVFTISYEMFEDYPQVDKYFNSLSKPTVIENNELDNTLSKTMSNSDATMTSIGLTFIALGGINLSIDFVKLHKGEDAGDLYTYFTYGAGFGANIGGGLSLGPVYFNESAGKAFNKYTFEGASFAKSVGFGPISSTSIKSYVNAEEECVFGINCGTLLYNAELGGAGPSKWTFGVSKTGNFSSLLSNNPMTKPTGSVDSFNSNNSELIDSNPNIETSQPVIDKGSTIS